MLWKVVWCVCFICLRLAYWCLNIWIFIEDALWTVTAMLLWWGICALGVTTLGIYWNILHTYVNFVDTVFFYLHQGVVFFWFLYGGYHDSTVVVCWTAGQQVEWWILHLGHDSSQNSSQLTDIEFTQKRRRKIFYICFVKGLQNPLKLTNKYFIMYIPIKMEHRFLWILSIVSCLVDMLCKRSEVFLLRCVVFCWDENI